MSSFLDVEAKHQKNILIFCLSSPSSFLSLISGNQIPINKVDTSYIQEKYKLNSFHAEFL
jgi:hypothetical protein